MDPSSASVNLSSSVQLKGEDLFPPIFDVAGNAERGFPAITMLDDLAGKPPRHSSDSETRRAKEHGP